MTVYLIENKKVKQTFNNVIRYYKKFIIYKDDAIKFKLLRDTSAYFSLSEKGD